MKVSIHAGKRFLERVMLKKEYSCFDINMAIEYLEKLLRDVVPTGHAKQFVLPGFENYRAVYRQNTIVTIIHKGRKYV